jgi:hypothetical protein
MTASSLLRRAPGNVNHAALCGTNNTFFGQVLPNIERPKYCSFDWNAQVS